MFIKDSSGLVINTDDAHYKSIVARRNQKKQIEKLNSDMSNLNSELCEIKTILKDLLNGKNYV
jgi:hypothetical protein